MSKQAEKLLREELAQRDELLWDEAVSLIASACGVKENTAETYIRRADSATTEVNANGEKILVDPAKATGQTVARDEDSLIAPIGGRTSRSYGQLPVLEDVGHSQVPSGHEDGYFKRKVVEGKTDVEAAACAMADKDYSLLLIGEAGVGKDRLALHICAKTNRPVIRPTMSGDGDLVDLLIGSYTPDEDGGFSFKKGLLTIAVEHGYTFIADEVNMLDGRLQTQMNDILEDADQAQLTIPETNEVIEPHEEFRFVGTMNPPKVGYGGTQDLNQAFQSRFIPIELPPLDASAERLVVAQNSGWSEDEDALNKLLDEDTGIIPSIRSLYDTGSISTWVSTRHVIQIARMAEGMGDPRAAAELVLTGHAKPEDKDPIRSAITDQNGW